MGISLTLSRDLATAIAQDVADGVPLHAAAERRGIGRSTALNWFAFGTEQRDQWHSGEPIDPESQSILRFFAEAITRARATLEANLATGLVKLAREGTRDDQVRLKAAEAVLTRHPAYRGEWGQQVTVQAHVDHRLLIAQLPPLEPAQALELYEQTRPALPPATG